MLSICHGNIGGPPIGVKENVAAGVVLLTLRININIDRQMKPHGIFNRYLFRELFPPMMINLGFFTFVFLMTKILDITNMIVNYRVNLLAVVLILMYHTPFFMIYILPMATMMSILLTFLRMSGDNEIVALKAAGLSIYSLLPPVLVFCLISSLLTGWMSMVGLPWGRIAFKQLIVNLATSNLAVGLKERAFNDTFSGVTLYVTEIDSQSNLLRDIFIEDRRNENIVSSISAARGQFFYDPGSLSYHFRLYNGDINQVDLDSRTSHAARFGTYDLRLALNAELSGQNSANKDEEEMFLPELTAYLKSADHGSKQYHIALTEFHRKFAIPFACIALGLLAVPFGIQSKRAKRSYGLALGLVFFLVYYLLLSAGWVLGEAGVYPPVIGMWVPNVVMGGAGIFFLIRAASERPLMIDESLSRLLNRFRKPA
jgi:lipopolysaccharide export system permease protein